MAHAAYALTGLAPYDDDGNVRVVIETPRGSSLKYKFDPELSAFTVARELPPGTVYPYDWGFIPGTRAEDGDPLDAMVLHAVPTFAGVVLPCVPFGVVKIAQREDGKRVENDRVILAPAWDGGARFDSLSKPAIAELEQFFLNAVYFTGKELRVVGWKGAKAVRRLIARLAVRAPS